MTIPPNFRQAVDNCLDCKYHKIKRTLSVARIQRVIDYCTKYDYQVSAITICDNYDKMVNIQVREHKEEK